jgi:YgiT-type zinc finger domain-containing protein
MKKCLLCKADYEKAYTTFTYDSGEMIIVIRKVPALVCSQCGEEWIDDKTSDKIEQIINEAKSRNSQVEILTMIA